MSKTYSISSISNRDLQILYHYRILRQPSSYLKAVYTDSRPTLIMLPETNQMSSADYYLVDDGGNAIPDRTPYWVFEVEVETHEDMVPMLEFLNSDHPGLATLTSVEVSKNKMKFLGSQQSAAGLQMNLYWVSSFASLQSILEGYGAELKMLKDAINNYQPATGEVVSSGVTITGGIPDNLVKVDDSGAGLVDSGYRITGPVKSQDLINLPNEELARLVREISGDVLIREDAEANHILQNTYGSGKITLSGSGTWYLTNVTNDVQLVNFKGSIYAVNCPAVRSSSSAFLEDVYLINSFMVHNNGTLNNLYLFERSTLKQNSGKITTLKHVGAGCEYYSGTSSSGEPAYSRDQIEGTACFASGLILINGKDVSFIAGQHEDPVPPSRIKVVIEGGT